MWVVAAHPHIPLPCLLCVNRDESGIQSSPAAGCRWAPSTGRMREGGGRLDVAGKGSFQVLSGCVYPEARTSAALRGQLHPEPPPPPQRTHHPLERTASVELCLHLPTSILLMPNAASQLPRLLQRGQGPSLALPGLPLPAVATVCLCTCSSPSHPSSPFFCSEEYFTSYRVFVLNVHSSP